MAKNLGLSAAQNAYYDALMGMQGQGSPDDILNYIEGLNDYQALASLANTQGRYKELTPGEDGFRTMSELTNMYGVPINNYGQPQATSINDVPVKNVGQSMASSNGTPQSFQKPSSSLNEDLVKKAYASIGRTDLGTNPGNIDQEGYNFWLEALNNGTLTEQNLNNSFGNAVDKYMVEKSSDPIENYVADYLVNSAYKDIGRTGIGSDVNQIDPSGYDFWNNAIKTGDVAATDFGNQFSNAVNKYVVEKPNDPYTDYVKDFIGKNTGSYLGSNLANANYLKASKLNGLGNGTPSFYNKTTGIGAAGDEMMGAGAADYQSPLIQALRNASNGPVSNNQGVTSYTLVNGK